MTGVVLALTAVLGAAPVPDSKGSTVPIAARAVTAPTATTAVSFAQLLPTDKLMHMSLCANLAMGGTALARMLGVRGRWALLAGVGLAMGAGVLKEVMDLRGSGTAEWRDIGADVVGTAAGMTATLFTGTF